MNEPPRQVKMPRFPVGSVVNQPALMLLSCDESEWLPATMLDVTTTSCVAQLRSAGSNSMPPPVPSAVLLVIVLLKTLRYVFEQANFTITPPPTLARFPLTVEPRMTWVFQPPPKLRPPPAPAAVLSTIDEWSTIS